MAAVDNSPEPPTRLHRPHIREPAGSATTTVSRSGRPGISNVFEPESLLQPPLSFLLRTLSLLAHSRTTLPLPIHPTYEYVLADDDASETAGMALTCPICDSFFSVAVRLPCCRQHICRGCAHHWLAHRGSRKCPFCRTYVTEQALLEPLPDQARLMAESPIRCIFARSGCQWIGPRRSVASHLQASCHVADAVGTGVVAHIWFQLESPCPHPLCPSNPQSTGSPSNLYQAVAHLPVPTKLGLATISCAALSTWVVIVASAMQRWMPHEPLSTHARAPLHRQGDTTIESLAALRTLAQVWTAHSSDTMPLNLRIESVSSVEGHGLHTSQCIVGDLGLLLVCAALTWHILLRLRFLHPSVLLDHICLALSFLGGVTYSLWLVQRVE
ncbi:uncharacterized protein BJ171DRAFT_211079 [Polychytrium aggregatum]|uniref:uncharacterized protein n=1 Tax=Polychytrium aggregatum TaxID=110093 RepID=UPI0022FE4A37|nr:uncharacterized protein BJ171DRAFT_211079 [Polychytrium aggregatum]KAI9208618.1 hypothetical protein BJ171DRAFT_211079 [Polychytrium aggregatum]